MLPNALVILPIASGSHSQGTMPKGETEACCLTKASWWLSGRVHFSWRLTVDYFPWLNTRMCLIPRILAWVLPDQESLFPLPFRSSFPCVPAYPTLVMEHFLVILSSSSFPLMVVLNWDLCSILSTIMMELLMSECASKIVVREDQEPKPASSGEAIGVCYLG